MSNPPTPNARQIPYHQSEAEIRYRIVVLLEAVDRLRELRDYLLPAFIECRIDDVVAESEFLRPDK